MRRTPRLLAESFLVLTTVIWGGTFVATRAGLAYVGPLSIIAIRFLVSFAIVAPVLALAGQKWWRHAGLGAVLGLANAGGYVLQTIGLEYTTAARSAFLTYLFAILIPPLQRVISRRSLSLANLAGLAVVVAGSALMTHPWNTSGWNTGDLLTLGSAVSYAFFIVLLDRFAQEIPAVDLIPSQFLVAGLVALVGALAFEGFHFTPAPAAFFTVGYLTLFGTLAALGLQTAFQGYTTPVRATTIYALEPVFAAIFGVAILGERIHGLEIAGGAVILSGVLLSELWEAFRHSRTRGRERDPGEDHDHPRDHDPCDSLAKKDRP